MSETQAWPYNKLRTKAKNGEGLVGGQKLTFFDSFYTFKKFQKKMSRQISPNFTNF